MVSILLVDDIRVIREVIKVYLIASHVTFLDAKDGEEALKLIREKKPDLVLADMRMPRLDGPGLCQALKADAALQHVPVIILTGEKDSASRERCIRAGALEVLTKPVQPRDLLQAVNRHLREPIFQHDVRP
ncbi:MAG: response regulator [Myxococcaceae bacterium]